MLNVWELGKKCQDRQDNGAHEQACFELFRRAIEDGDEAAWQVVSQTYYPLVRYWITRYELPAECEVDELVLITFSHFWHHYKAEKLEKASHHLSSVLDYLKTCAVTMVQDARRQAAQTHLNYDDMGKLSEMLPAEQRLELQALWEKVLALCNSLEEEEIAYQSFVLGMPPREIVKVAPELFDSVQDVNRIKRNLLGRLKRNLEI